MMNGEYHNMKDGKKMKKGEYSAKYKKEWAAKDARAKKIKDASKKKRSAEKK